MIGIWGQWKGELMTENTAVNRELGNMKDEHSAWLGKIGFLSRT